MIPHKSRQFQTILDLSFQLQHKGKLMESVNSTTVKQAPAEAMIQLGNYIKHLVATLADNYDTNNPFYFAKLNMKVGFWQMVVANEDAWNFCYMLPSRIPGRPLEETEIVVPKCLQMGWCKSPPFFCAASKTAQDVITALLKEAVLPLYPLEGDMLSKATLDTMHCLHATAAYVNPIEVFVDDFLAMTNNFSKEHLQKISQAMLHGIHSVFPPPSTSDHDEHDPISQKKLNAGEGTWETTTKFWDDSLMAQCSRYRSQKKNSTRS